MVALDFIETEKRGGERGLVIGSPPVCVAYRSVIARLQSKGSGNMGDGERKP